MAAGADRRQRCLLDAGRIYELIENYLGSAIAGVVEAHRLALGRTATRILNMGATGGTFRQIGACWAPGC